MSKTKAEIQTLEAENKELKKELKKELDQRELERNERLYRRVVAENVALGGHGAW